MGCTGCHTVKTGEPLKDLSGDDRPPTGAGELAEAILIPNKTLA